MPTLDVRVLGILRNLQSPGEPDIVAQLTDLYLQELPARMVRLGQAIERGDASELAKAAHSLKGSSANMGARRVAQLCLDLENKGKTGELAGAADMFAQLEKEIESARVALIKERGDAA
jgi:HPt (histidine-containing phosphotransfer) domain-containing protein